jgi:F420-dependent oxidoreductase-like protein
MKLSTSLPWAGRMGDTARRVAEWERDGLDLVWVPEAYGFDAPSMMGYLAAITERVEIASSIMAIYTRTPTLLAMTAAGVDSLSDGRCQLGIGASGPQVVEGWHGVPFDSPLARTREIVEICRQVWARDGVLVHAGPHYRLPLPPDQGSGLGKPLKLVSRPVRSRIPIWLAALGQRNVALAAEIAEGWLPFLFVPERARAVWGAALDEGIARRDPALGPLQIAAGGLLAIGDGEEVRKVREQARPMVALYVGGMGAPGRNFYNDLAGRYGYEKEAAEIQELYLSGRKEAAEALVPEELLELTSLAGPDSWVAERIAAYREAGVTHLQVFPVPVGAQSERQLIARVRELAG